MPRNSSPQYTTRAFRRSPYSKCFMTTQRMSSHGSSVTPQPQISSDMSVVYVSGCIGVWRVADFDFHGAAIVENGFNGCAVGSFYKLAVCIAALVDNAAGKE